jgi:hypothetical protein
VVDFLAPCRLIARATDLLDDEALDLAPDVGTILTGTLPWSMRDCVPPQRPEP